MSTTLKYGRRKAHEVTFGGVKIGSENPIAVQSMTNTPTADVTLSVEQTEHDVMRIVGCDLVFAAVVPTGGAQRIDRAVGLDEMVHQSDVAARIFVKLFSVEHKAHEHERIIADIVAATGIRRD